MEQESLFFSMGGFVLQLESFGLLTNPYFSWDLDMEALLDI